jgi:hypothetical protein
MSRSLASVAHQPISCATLAAMLAPLLLALALAFGVPHAGQRTSGQTTAQTRVAPAEAGPDAGDCYADTNEELGDLQPDYATKVACTEPHVWEIVATVKLPTTLLDTSSPENSLKRRDELATYGDVLSPLQKQLDKVVLPRCHAARNELIGVADLPIDNGETIGSRIEPLFGHALYWVNVMPADAWAAGRTEAVCSMRFEDEDKEPRMVRSPNRQPLIAAWMTSKFPATERLCVDDDFEVAACDQTHMFEQLWALDAADILGAPQSATLSPKQEDTISLLCNLLYGAATGDMPKRDTMLAIDMPGDNDGWRTCIVRNRPDGKNLPMNPGFVAFAK